MTPYAMRRFVGLDFVVEQVPDATTLLNFRHLLEEHRLGEKLFTVQNVMFEAQGPPNSDGGSGPAKSAQTCGSLS